MRREEIITSTLKDVPGYGGKYRANPQGQVVRVYGSGKMKLMGQYLRRNRFVVKLTAGGVSREIPAATAILLTFRGMCPAGMVPHHRNGIRSDNRLDNLEYIGRQELGRKTGHRSRSQPVLKVSENGEAVEAYRSAREAAKYNHMSYQAVMDRCNGKVEHPFALDGYSYVWEDGRPGRPQKKEEKE